MYKIKMPAEDGVVREIHTASGDALLGSTSSLGLEIKELDEEKKTFWAVASTAAVDREGDILEVAGWELENYKRVPVGLWSHNSFAAPIFKTIEIRLTKTQMLFKPEFDTNEFASFVFGLYARGFMRAFSVGFRFMEWEWIRETNPEGVQRIIGRRSLSQELFEISAVNVGANPEALALIGDKGGLVPVQEASPEPLHKGFYFVATEAWQKGMTPVLEDLGGGVFQETCGGEAIAFRFSDSGWNPDTIKAWATFYPDRFKSQPPLQMPWLTRTVGVKTSETEKENKASSGLENKDEKSAIAYSIHGDVVKAKEDRGWSSSLAAQNLAKWAGGPEADKIDWGKYRKGFGWKKDSDSEELGNYKLPHHDVIAGQLGVVWSGTRAAMAELLGARGGIIIPAKDRRIIHEHLAKHYEQFDKTSPEFRDYEIDELTSLFKDLMEEEDSGILLSVEMRDSLRGALEVIDKVLAESTKDEKKPDDRDMKENEMIKKIAKEVRLELENILSEVARELSELKRLIVEPKDQPDNLVKIFAALAPDKDEKNQGETRALIDAFAPKVEEAIIKVAADFSTQVASLISSVKGQLED